MSAMSKGILGIKLGMSQIFSSDGKAVPVTLIKAGPCVITQIKTSKKDGYDAIQIGFGEIKNSRVNAPARGHFVAKGLTPMRYLKELRCSSEDYKVGMELKADVFSEGDRADVIGISKGKGFAGVIKRHGFAGGPASHGSHLHRAPGSIGQCATPSRVFKGKKLPGRMGGGQVTALGLEVVKVRLEDNLILIKGCVPGAKGNVVLVRDSVKRKARSAGKKKSADAAD